MIRKHFKECSSTQIELKKLIQEHPNKENLLKESILVSAASQTAGKGQKDNKWITFPGSLAISFTLKPNEIIQLTPIEVGILTCKFMDEYLGIPLQLKWPNDLIYRDKKVGGIIMELFEKTTLVGLGINFSNLDQESFGQFRFPATSLESTKPDGIEDELYKFLSTKRLSEKVVIENFQSLCHHSNREVQIIPEKIRGTFLFINRDGSAKIRLDSGEERNIYSGSLIY